MSNEQKKTLFSFTSLCRDFNCFLTTLLLNLTHLLGSPMVVTHCIRPGLLKLFGFKFGKKCIVLPGLYLHSSLDDVVVGDHTFINHNCFFDASSSVKIGHHCQIGFNVSFVTSSHQLDTNFVGRRPDISRPIEVGDYVWICAGATILGGVTIGEGSVVAAGAVVSKDVPPNSVVGGIPAKVIKRINERKEQSQDAVGFTIESPVERVFSGSKKGKRQ